MYCEPRICVECGGPISDFEFERVYNRLDTEMTFGLHPDLDPSHPHFCDKRCYHAQMDKRIKSHLPNREKELAEFKEKLKACQKSMDVTESYYRQNYEPSSALTEKIEHEKEPNRQLIAMYTKDWESKQSYDEMMAVFPAHRDFLKDWATAKFHWDKKNPPPMEAIIPTIDESHWYGHCLLLAQTRFGKTNVIRWRLSQLLPQIAQGRASVILMEPKGVLTDELLHLADVWNMRDRLVILDPMDTRVSVNIFDKGDGSDHAIQSTIARVARVLNTVTMTLTPFQTDTLMYSLRAMFCVDQPGSMRLLTSILRRGIKGLELRDVPYSVQEFFDHDFKAGDGSSQQVVTRLNSLLANPVFEALFAADRTTFSMLDELQLGKLIVINASAADNLYARFWIEQVSSCITPRFRIPYDKRIPTTFIIDEAQTWISDDLHFAGILDKAAEARIGMLIAFHDMSQIKDLQVRGSIYTNTTLKFTAQTSSDINALCRSMGMTEPHFLNTLPKYEFAHFGPDMKSAIKIKLPLVEFDKLPRMTEAQYHELRANNRTRYSYVRTSQAQPQSETILPTPVKRPTPQQKPNPDDDASTDWTPPNRV